MAGNAMKRGRSQQPVFEKTQQRAKEAIMLIHFAKFVLGLVQQACSCSATKYLRVQQVDLSVHKTLSQIRRWFYSNLIIPLLQDILLQCFSSFAQ